MTLRLVAQPNGLLIPVDDLRLKNLPNRDLIVGDDLQIVLANLLGFDGNQPRLLKVDPFGNLKATMAFQAATGLTVAPAIDNLNFDHQQLTALGPGLASAARVRLVNGNDANNGAVSQREASSFNLATLQSFGAAMTAPPGEWSVPAQPAAGSQASASRAAGGAGVRHVLRGFGFGAGSVAAPVLTQLNVNVRDGASGAGTVLKAIVVIILAAAGQNIPPIEVNGLNVVGSANTAMTVEFSAGLANLFEYTSLTGYDAIL